MRWDILHIIAQICQSPIQTAYSLLTCPNLVDNILWIIKARTFTQNWILFRRIEARHTSRLSFPRFYRVSYFDLSQIVLRLYSVVDPLCASMTKEKSKVSTSTRHDGKTKYSQDEVDTIQ